jgi:hypothetical protein
MYERECPTLLNHFRSHLYCHKYVVPPSLPSERDLNYVCLQKILNLLLSEAVEEQINRKRRDTNEKLTNFPPSVYGPDLEKWNTANR